MKQLLLSLARHSPAYALPECRHTEHFSRGHARAHLMPCSPTQSVPEGNPLAQLPPMEDNASPACYDSSGEREHTNATSCLSVRLYAATKFPGIQNIIWETFFSLMIGHKLLAIIIMIMIIITSIEALKNSLKKSTNSLIFNSYYFYICILTMFIVILYHYSDVKCMYQCNNSTGVLWCCSSNKHIICLFTCSLFYKENIFL